MGLQNLLSKARRLARGREDQIGSGLDKAERAISERTGGKYDEKVKNARRKVDENLTGGQEGADRQDQQGQADRQDQADRRDQADQQDQPDAQRPRRDDTDNR